MLRMIPITNAQLNATVAFVVQRLRSKGRDVGVTMAEEPAVIVSVVVPLALTEDELKLQLAPDGKPEQAELAKLTEPLKPFTGTTVNVVVPVPPALAMFTAAGLAEITKSAAPPLPTPHSFTRL